VVKVQLAAASAACTSFASRYIGLHTTLVRNSVPWNCFIVCAPLLCNDFALFGDY